MSHDEQIVPMIGKAYFKTKSGFWFGARGDKLLMKNQYFLCHGAVKFLLNSSISEDDKAALSRLEEFNGSGDDLKLAAKLFDDAGEHVTAESLRTQLRE